MKSATEWAQITFKELCNNFAISKDSDSHECERILEKHFKMAMINVLIELKKTKLVDPVPPPRYDEVFFEGTARLDADGGYIEYPYDIEEQVLRLLDDSKPRRMRDVVEDLSFVEPPIVRQAVRNLVFDGVLNVTLDLKVVKRKPEEPSKLPASDNHFVDWPDDLLPRFITNTACDMWSGPCACGAWHKDGT